MRPPLPTEKASRHKIGITAQKTLILLMGGVALAFAGSPNRYGRILKSVDRAWRDISRKQLSQAIRKLYESQLISFTQHSDGTTEIVLTREGHNLALRYNLDTLKIRKPERWDKKWRVILFDIPEEQKALRDSLREQLQKLGCVLLQKSVFVHPYECRNEIDFVIELFGARRYVRFIEAVSIDNELHLKKKFDLL